MMETDSLSAVVSRIAGLTLVTDIIEDLLKVSGRNSRNRLKLDYIPTICVRSLVILSKSG